VRHVPVPALARYLLQLKRRLSLGLTARGLGIGVGAALVLTVAGVLLARSFGFTPWSIVAARTFLFASVAAVAGWFLLRPLAGLRRERWIRHVEGTDGPFAERLRTVLDRGQDTAEPMWHLLAGETLERSASLPPARLVPSRRIVLWASAALGFLLSIVWMGARGPGYLGHGTALLWAGWLHTPLVHRVAVEPGSTTIRRRADLLIRARPVGFFAETARLFVRHGEAGAWETVPMRARADAEGFEFVLAGVDASLRYRVEAGPATSDEYTVKVEELPQVRAIRLVYHYPDWTQLPVHTEERGGDVRAVAGTTVDVQIETDRPLKAGALQVNESERVPLESGSTTSVGRLPVEKDGRYYVAALYGADVVRLSDDYLIEVTPDRPPVPQVAHPGRDVRATSIEEVTMRLAAEDDFAVRGLELRYAVNGGAETTVPLTASGESAHTFALEPHRLAPGDLVSYYAVARDAKTEARTDMYFIEVTPFEREFFQSQENGGGAGGGGGGDEAQQIPRRQKELIVATWNLTREVTPDPAKAREDAKALAEMQTRLQAQAVMLAERMRRRGLAEVDGDFQAFVTNMDEAAEAMGKAAEPLSRGQWTRALPSEQQALQHLLRAEAVFRRIQVSRGQQRGGGGGGSEGRDLAEMFEIELDAQKNQYETRPPATSAAQREIDELQRKIQELARRHEQAAGERARQEARLEQRWEQQVLRREIEELARELERLQQREADERRQQQQQRQQQAQGQPGATAERSAAMEGARRRLEEAARSLQEAERAGRPEEQQAAEARVRQRLREARDMLGQAGQGSGTDRRSAERALEGLQRARGRLEPLRAGRAQATPQPGGAAADDARRGESAQGGDRAGGGTHGDLRDDPRGAARAMREALDDLEAARRALEGDRDLGPAAERLRQQLERVLPGARGDLSSRNPELIDRELEAVLRAAEPIEEALRRRLDVAGGPPVRTLTTPDMPAEHRDAIAEYYRRLSESK